MYLHDNLRPIGGAETAFYQELEAARERFEVAAHVFDDGAERPAPVGAAVSPYRLQGSPVDHLRYHYFCPGTYRRLRRLVLDFAPDVIHVHKHDKQTLTQLAATRGFPVVHTVHDFGLVCPTAWLVTARTRRACPGGAGWKCVREGCVPLGRFLASYTLPRALKAWARARRIAAWVTPSQALADTLVRHGWPRPRVVPYIQAAPAAVPPPGAGPPRVVFLGHLIASKGVDVLVEAFEAVAAAVPQAELELVGAGELRLALEARVQAAGLADRVHFAGRLEHHQAVARLDRATVAVVPSVWTENSALVAYEALSRGRALVASRIGGLPELCRQGETGLLAEPGDPVSLAAALEALLRDPARAAAMGRAGHRLVRERFSAEAHMESLEEIYREVVAR